MLTNVTVANAAKLLYYSDLYELADLKSQVMQFIGRKGKEVMKSSDWKQFIQIKPALMEELLAKILDIS